MRVNKIDRQRHKTSCCATCLVVTIIIFVILCGALCGGAYFAYDRFAKPVIGISMGDAFGVLGGLYKYNEKEIVTNPFTEADRTSFYSKFEQATYLDLPDDFAIVDLVNGYMNGQGGNGDNGEGDKSVALAEGGSSIKDFTTGNAYLDSVLKELEFDFSSLKDYENGGSDLTLKDTEFAAILDEVVEGLDIPQVKQIENQLGVKLGQLVNVKQVNIVAPKTVEEYMEEGVEVPGEETPADPAKKDIKIELVLEVNVGDNIVAILKHLGLPSSIPDFVYSMAKGLLPKKIFVGAGVYPYDSSRKPEIFINEIAGEVMENFETAVNNALKYSGSEMNLNTIFEKVSTVVASTVVTIEKYVGNLNLIDSTMSIDPIEALMNALKINTESTPQDKRVTSEQFLTMLKYVYSVDNEAGDMDIHDYVINKVGAENVPSEEDFINDKNNLANAYGLSSGEVDISKWAPQDFISKYSTLPQYIAVNKMNADGKYLYEFTQEEMLALTRLEDNSLGYIINDILKNGTGIGEDGGKIDLPVGVNVESLVLNKSNGVGISDMTIGINTDKVVDELVGKDNVLSKLIDSLIPDNIYMSVKLPMKRDSGIDTGVVINFIGEGEDGETKTRAAFGTLTRMVGAISAEMAAKLDIDKIIETVENYVYDALDKLKGQKESTVAMASEEEKISIDITFEEGYVKLPTVYELMADMTNKKLEEGEPQVEPEQLQKVLKGLYTYEDAERISSDALDGKDGFIVREIENKMFINNYVGEDGNKIIRPDNLLDALTKLPDRIKDENEGVGNVVRAREMVNDTRSNINDLKLFMSGTELGAIINGSGKLDGIGGSVPYNNIGVVSVSFSKGTDGNDYMDIVIRADFDKEGSLGSEGPMGIKYENILPQSMYIKASIQMTGGEIQYSTDILINSIDGEDKAILNAVLKGLAGDKPDMSLDAIEDKIAENVGEAMNGITSGSGDITYSEQGITAMSIYDLIYDNMVKSGDPEGKLTPQDVMTIFKSALKETEYTSNIAESLDRMITEELHGKMFIKKEVVDSNNVVGSLTELSGSKDIFTSIDLGMSLNKTSVEELNIMFTEKEMAAIMAQEFLKYGVNGMPEIFANEKFEGIFITSDTTVKCIIVVDVVPENDTEGKYSNILPFLPDKMVLEVDMDMSSRPFKSRLIINDYQTDEKASMLMKILAGESFDLDAINNSIAKNFEEVIDKLENAGVPLTFDAEKKEVRSGNIYDVMRKNDEATFGDIASQDIHDVMRGIFDEDRESMIINPKQEPLDPGEIDIDFIDMTASISDKYIAYKLLNGEIRDNNKVVGTIMQAAILNDDSDEIISGYDMAYERFGDVIGKKSIILSALINMEGYRGTAEGFENIIPDTIMVTVVFNIDNSGVTLTPLVNNMNGKDMDTLRKILNSSEGDDVLDRICENIKKEVLNAGISVAGNIVTLGDILMSEQTVFENVANGTANDGMFGKVKYKFA